MKRKSDFEINQFIYISLPAASLVTWTKGFSATGVVDQDVAKLLSEACKRRVSNVTSGDDM